jgi:hypothetical protein
MTRDGFYECSIPALVFALGHEYEGLLVDAIYMMQSDKPTTRDKPLNHCQRTPKRKKRIIIIVN